MPRLSEPNSRPAPTHRPLSPIQNGPSASSRPPSIPESRPLRAQLFFALFAAAIAFATSAPAAEAAEKAQPTIDEADAARLEALGYVEFSTDTGEEQGGVSRFDKERAAPGHSLVVSSKTCSAQLLDLDGSLLHSWSQERCKHWWGAALLPNGDLFVNGSLIALPPRPSGKPRKISFKSSLRFTARIAWTGERKWILMMRSHHQLDTTAQAGVLILTEAKIPEARAAAIDEVLGRPEDAGTVTYHDNALRWLDGKGSVTKTVSLWDAVNESETEFPHASPEALMEGSHDVGLFHCNSAFAMNQAGLANTHPLYSEHNVLATSRNQNRIFIVNGETKALVWQWGLDELQAPHYATWLANGNVLVFDNGVERNYSRILEVNPKDNTIVWQYPEPAAVADPEVLFFTKSRGGAQRLSNGNTLIVESNSGRAFEITRDGDVVWEYRTELLDNKKSGRADKRKRPVLITMRRYPESYLQVPLN